MLRNCFSLFLTFLVAFSCFGQNLVPNPSFEDTVQCPEPVSTIDYAENWVNPTTYSPDYFHSCAVGSFSVPNNYYGSTNARTGNAYGGIYIPVAGSNGREYIQCQLIDTLISGQNYYVQFFVALADSCEYAVNDLGIYFSSTQVSSSNDIVLPYIPQVENDINNNPLNIKEEWLEVKGIFTANGGEKYITIGCFKDDNNVDTLSVSGGADWAESFYYIDDIYIGLSPLSIEELNQNEFIVNIYPNPVNDLLNINVKFDSLKEISLYNSLGKLIIKEKAKQSNFYQIDLNSVSNGYYFIELLSQNNYRQIKPIIIN